jgi:malate synthase
MIGVGSKRSEDRRVSQTDERAPPAGVRVLAPVPAEAGAEILTPEALAFVAALHRRFEPQRQALLGRRLARQRELDAGWLPDFLTETADVRAADWRVAPVPADLQDRRVEITGPVERKMIINALNSGANCFMADFEDSCSPTWANVVAGQANLRDAVAGTIELTDSRTGKHYALGEKVATLLVRPRGWHLVEKHVRIDDAPVSASIFDFGLYFFHNARALLARGTGPYFYLPKMESHLEARLWNDVFVAAQDALGLPRGTIKATVLIETILAAFEMDEILYELREHAAGLNCGRWDYIFSFIKRFRRRADCMLPDRAQVGMDRHFLKSYVELLIRTCHRRGAHAMGGMAAQIPIRDDPEANARAMRRVQEDKEREARAGHDGTWVAHPGLVGVAREAFDAVMHGPNQLDVLREDVRVTAADLLEVPEGDVTEAGLRHNIRVGVQYLEAWLRGNGCVPLYHLMEDAATAEICRTQLWQWRTHGARLTDGTRVTRELIERAMDEELQQIAVEVGQERFAAGRYELAAKLFGDMVLADELDEFLTLPAYELID